MDGNTGEPVLTEEAGETVWLWRKYGSGAVLMVGTNLAADLADYREGDSARVGSQPEMLWGFSNERPVHLYEAQLAGEPKGARFADEWAAVIAREVAAKSGITLPPLLPGGAAGAIVLTGDDDAAELRCYATQLRLIGDLPMTYFMHPDTRHNRRSIRKMLLRSTIDLGIHPDALTAPNRYDELLIEQVTWFRATFDREPRCVRNHGFLSNGFWGHLPAWIKSGLLVSSNIPGFDGRVLNGSLLPARIAAGGGLTSHWSMLTVLGDGILFVEEAEAKDGARAVFDLADSIRNHPIPGVMVLNLHPQNVEKSASMHRAVLDVAASGFVPWTLAECAAWFAARDGTALWPTTPRPSARNTKIPRRSFLGRLSSALGSLASRGSENRSDARAQK